MKEGGNEREKAILFKVRFSQAQTPPSPIPTLSLYKPFYAPLYEQELV